MSFPVGSPANLPQITLMNADFALTYPQYSSGAASILTCIHGPGRP